MSTQTELPMYQCHKQVRALRIAAIEIHQDLSATIAPIDAGYAPFKTRPGWAERFQGNESDPGVYVVYEDGFSSWSPSAPFDAGYSLIEA